MKTSTAAVVALVFAAAGLAGGYWLASSRSAPHAPAAGSMADAPRTETAQGGGERRILYWYDPMYPQQKFDKPGRSPFMDMDLVPKYADESGDESKVSISPRVVQNLGIRTVEAVTGSLERRVEGVGAIAYNERATVVVAPRANAFVERLHVRAALDPVTRGQPLVELLIPEWAGAQEEYLQLRRSTLPGVEDLRAAARQRLVLLGMTEEQIQAVEQAGRAMPRITITAPISGVIAELGVRDGMTLAMGMPLFRIVDLGTVWVNAEIPEAQAGGLRPGLKVEARVPAYPGEMFRGVVSALLPEVEAQTRTVRARIELANPGAKLKPGMYATLSLGSGSGKPMVLVPTEAVIRTGARNVVIVAASEGRFRPVDVEVGIESGGQTEIRKGLDAGERVVVSGQFLIDSEASLRATGTRMQAPKPENTHVAEGLVEHVDPDEITISHGAVPSARMGAMTMPFKLPKTGVAVVPKTGDRVRFEFSIEPSGDFLIRSLERVGSGSAAAADPQAGQGSARGAK